MIRRGTLPFLDPSVPSYAADGKHVAIGNERGDVLILDTQTGTPVRPGQSVSESWINTLVYSPDSSLALASAGDGSVSLFDGESAALLGTVTMPNHQIVTADFRADGHTVVIGSFDDGVYLWDTRLEHAIETACRMAGRDLTRDEWRETFDDRPLCQDLLEGAEED